MAMDKTFREVPLEELRWRLDPAELPFETTETLSPLTEILGQSRAVQAFRFGMNMDKQGYNVFVTGVSGTGRLSTVRRLIKEISGDRPVPPDLCYVNNFENPEAPLLITLPAGMGHAFRKAVADYGEVLKKEVPQLFESQEYINTKKEILETYENRGKAFFKALEQKVKEEGFALVDIQLGQVKRPDVMPLVDGNPTHIDQLEEMTQKGRFPREEFQTLKEKHGKLRAQIDQIFMELRELQKEVQTKLENMDRVLFVESAGRLAEPIRKQFQTEAVGRYLRAVIEDMADNLQIFRPQAPQAMMGMFPLVQEANPFQPYQVNLLVDNRDKEGPPVIVESYPTYRNLFGSIERVVDRSGLWKTDFSRIKAGSLIRANGGYLVINLIDAIMEPGVWPALKRALKSKRLEIETYDPFYLFTTTGLKPQPIDLTVKVVVIGDPYLYTLLLMYDEDTRKIFKVRADFETSMKRDPETVQKFCAFVKALIDRERLLPFDREAVAALIEEAVRMTGRQERISMSFLFVTDLLREAHYHALADGEGLVRAPHVEKAVSARIYRSNLIEEEIQEMIDRGTLLIDTKGAVVGQVNGLAVYHLGDHAFGRPTRITATTSMGRAGIINIEREADLSGSTHNKGVLILAGYLRNQYAQNRPITMSASLAFEQSYSGVDGDSASSTEIYALLSSLSGVPLRQDLAVTGSVNQKGEVQAIGGVNEKIEGFFDCCRHLGPEPTQGVLIPESNRKDLILRKDVLQAVKEGRFHIYPVRTIDEGIEILTGMEAGERGPDGAFPEGSLNALVDRRLKELAEGLRAFDAREERPEPRSRTGRRLPRRKKA